MRSLSPARDGASIGLGLLLTSASLLVFWYRPELGDARRWILALVLTGFLLAPASARRAPLGFWLAGALIVAWGGRLAADGVGGILLWLGLSVLGSGLVVSGGAAATRFYLPEAGTEEGRRLQSEIRRQLQLAAIAFSVVFVADGEWSEPSGALVATRWLLLFVSAAFFLRYCLLQAKHLKLPAVPLLAPPEAAGVVPSQRWPLLALMAVVGATKLPDRLVGPEELGALVLTSTLVLVLAGLLFVLSLVELQKNAGWKRPLVRRASFLGGMALAVALTACVVELERWGPERFSFFATVTTFSVLVVPFLHSTTKLFRPFPHASELVGPAVLSTMVAPVAGVNGLRWSLASSGFLYCFALLMVVYQLAVVWRERARGQAYLLASLFVLLAMLWPGGTAWSPSGGAWKQFLVALSIALFAVDLLDRARVAKGSRA